MVSFPFLRLFRWRLLGFFLYSFHEAVCVQLIRLCLAHVAHLWMSVYKLLHVSLIAVCVWGKVIEGVFVGWMFICAHWCSAVWGSVFLTLLNHPAHLSLMTIWGQDWAFEQWRNEAEVSEGEKTLKRGLWGESGRGIEHRLVCPPPTFLSVPLISTHFPGFSPTPTLIVCSCRVSMVTFFWDGKA